MAEHHSLQYWLESINLPQYYLGFVQHGVYTLERCENLDEETLSEIGVSLEGELIGSFVCQKVGPLKSR